METLGARFRALVIGASGGIGCALVDELQALEACCAVATLSRSEGDFDLLDEKTIATQAANFAKDQFDLIVCATGVLTIDGIGPEKSIREINPGAMAAQFAVNAIGPALVLKHFTPLLPKSKRSVFAVLSARVGSIGDNRLGGWISYRSSKAALNQIVRTTAIEVARTRPQAVIVSLHPGTVDTPLSRPFAANYHSRAPKDAASTILATLDGLPLAASGDFFAYDGSRVEW